MKLTGNNTNVLVIDDDKDILLQAERILKTLEVRNIYCADTTQKAIDLIEARRYNLIVCDLRMPHVSGSSLIQIIRNHKNPSVANTPIMVVYGTIAKDEAALLSEIDMLTPQRKPFANEDFSKAVLESMRKTDVHSAAEFVDSTDNVQFGRIINDCLNSGQIELARKTLAPKLAKDPNSCRLNNYLARILFAEGKFNETDLLVTKILKINADYLPAINLRVKVLIKKKDYDAALALMEKAQTMSPLNTQRLIGMGEIQLAAGRLTAAEDKFRRALKLVPDLEAANIGLAKVQIERGNKDAGLKLLAGLEDPQAVVSEINLKGVLLVKSGDLDNGMNFYKKALEYSVDASNQYAMHYNLGLASRKKGDLNAARKHYSKALELKPDFLKAKVALLKLPPVSNSFKALAESNYSSVKPTYETIVLTPAQIDLLLGNRHGSVSNKEAAEEMATLTYKTETDDKGESKENVYAEMTIG